MSANVQSMMYTGAIPWHGLGKKLDNAATSAEAIEAAGLNWEVAKQPIYLTNNDVAALPIPDNFAVVRQDNKINLGIVGGRYTPLQNKEAFKFFDSVVGIQEAMYHTAGALGNGERVWILAKLPGYIQVTGDDIIDKYLLLSNSHDGSSMVTMMFTPIRVVCQNTLNIALSEGTNRAKARHTNSVLMKVNDIQKQLGIVKYQYLMFEEACKGMVQKQVSTSTLEKFYEDIGLVPATPEAKMSSRAQNILTEVTRLFENGRGNDLPGVKGTVWAAFNSVTEYTDYARATRASVNEADSRADSLLFGSGASLKQKAWDAAVELAKAA